MKELRFHGEVIVTGLDSIQYLQKVDCQRVLIITGGSSMFKNNTIGIIEKILHTKGCSVEVYSGIRSNPTTTEVSAAVKKAKAFQPDTVLGVGGGSAIDAAKVITLFYEYPDLDFVFARHNLLPGRRVRTKFIAIPSTSGTAAEVTRAAVITYPEDNIKIGLKTNAFIPDIAILDAHLTLSMPKHVVAETGMDAMTHAVECFVNKNSDDFTQVLARGAIEGLFKYLPISYDQGDSYSREKVHNFQAMAGCAFTNVGLGMGHGISHALGGMYNYGHGLINAVALPYVLEYNSQDGEVQQKLDYLASAIGVTDFIDGIKGLNKKLNIPENFHKMGITSQEFEHNFEELLDNSLQGSTQSNPISIDRTQMKKILWSIFLGKPSW